jgi:hypothetical protein
MNRNRIATLVLGLGLLSIGSASCDIFDPYDPGNGGGNGGGCGGGDTVISYPEERAFEAKGTVHMLVTEEGDNFWGIEATDGKKYEPVNLPEAFLREGAQVEFKANLLGDWQSIYGYGEIIEILEIKDAN